MIENSSTLLDELRPLVTNISRKVLVQVAPDECQMADFFMQSYYGTLLSPSDLASKSFEGDTPLAFGTPDIMSALVIPIVLTILTELVKDGLIPAIEKRIKGKQKKSEPKKLEIIQKLQPIGKDYEGAIYVVVKNRKLAKKIMVAVLAAIESEI